MPHGLSIEITVLGHQLYMAWCPHCLRSEAFLRLYLAIGEQRSVKRWCLVCAYEPPKDEE